MQMEHHSFSNSYDVVIVGGGPAGASAAYCLATAGIKAIVLEKGSLPRYKTCGGGIVRRGLRRLPIAIGDAVERECFTAEIHLHDAGLRFETRRQVPIVSMTMRDRFDYLLLSAAREAGADIACCEVLDVCPHREQVELLTSHGPLHTRFVIAADGALSTVARKTNWPDNRPFIPALEYEVTVGDSLLARFAQSARFDFGVVPCGYGWVFPKKEHLSIGVFTLRRGGANLNEKFHSYLRLLGIAQAPRMERHGSLIPVTTRRAPFAIGRILLVGDAAGFVDPLTGEGISFAIRSGQIAARSLVGGNLAAEEVIHTYNAEIAGGILSELRAAKILSRLLYHHPALRSLLFRLYGQRFSEVVTDIMAGDRTYRGVIGNPSNYIELFKVAGKRIRTTVAGRI
jgi:geranylgeranyl reductase family protein